ncbi:MAG: hypothetical protein GXY44_06250 [Phycisphaerales bacterium]|nr:hypothetical protein [Phycisphaerales bacterium]
MHKRYVVRLSHEEREQLTGIVTKFKGTSHKVRRAQILLKANVNGPHWADQRMADTFGCRRQTVENVRQRLVERGFAEAINGAQRSSPPTPKLLDGVQEAKLIAMRLGPSPQNPRAPDSPAFRRWFGGNARSPHCPSGYAAGSSCALPQRTTRFRQTPASSIFHANSRCRTSGWVRA